MAGGTHCCSLIIAAEEALNEKRYSLNQEKLLLAAEKSRFCSEKWEP